MVVYSAVEEEGLHLARGVGRWSGKRGGWRSVQAWGFYRSVALPSFLFAVWSYVHGVTCIMLAGIRGTFLLVWPHALFHLYCVSTMVLQLRPYL